MSFAVAASGNRNITFLVSTVGSGVYTTPGNNIRQFDCNYTLMGGGGGGGGGQDAGGGGGGSSEIKLDMFDINGTKTVSYTIGNGGAGGSNGNGSNGASSTLTPQGQSIITANGGSGGNTSDQITGAGGAGGAGGAYGGGGGGGAFTKPDGAGGTGTIANGQSGNSGDGGSGGGGGGTGGNKATFPGGYTAAGGGGGGVGGGNGGNGTAIGSNATGAGAGGGGGGGGLNRGGDGGGGLMKLVLVRREDLYPITYTVFNGANRSFTIPPTASSVTVEMIGAGGFTGVYSPAGLIGSTTGGSGGYIKMNLTNIAPLLGKTILIQAGSSVGASNITAPATFISAIAAGPLLAVAGSGGNGPSVTGTDSFRTLYAGAGGHGGGGVFSLIGGGPGAFAGGTSGDTVNLVSTYNGGSGGTNTGGAGGTVAPPGGGTGQNGNNPSGFQPVSGGAGTTVFLIQGQVITSAGGGGYAGGGGGAYANALDYASAGGGGGSSYINNTYVSMVASYPGNFVPGGVLSGYGRAGQGGYISVTITF